MNKAVIKRILITCVETCVITGIVLFSVFPVSCKVTTQGIQIIGGNYKAPELLSVDVIDENAVSLSFSDEIQLENLIVSPYVSGISDSAEASVDLSLSDALAAASGTYGTLACSVVYSNENKTASVIFNEQTETGKNYEIYGQVSDKTGNTLTFCVPFTGYNSHVPYIQMTEVHPVMAAVQKTEDSGGTRRLEYVECLALSDGNLAGLELCSGYAGEDKCYELPAVEVHKGEIFVIHPRSWGEGCISEESDDLSLSFSRYCGQWRDLWNSSTGKPMDDKNDVLVIKNKITGKIMDSCIFTDGTVNWSEYLKTDYTKADGFEALFPDGADAAACSSTGIGTVKVFARNTNTGVWSIAAASPGSL